MSDKGLVSGNAKGNKDIQKGMQKIAGTKKAKRNERNANAIKPTTIASQR